VRRVNEQADVPTAPERVSAVELFFDVVFAFTLTQLTRALERDLTLENVGRLLLVFAALWYMYGGYAWLTNHVPPVKARQKLVMFAGMAGLFVAAIAIPRAFTGASVLFGAGYLLVVVVHLALFTQSDVGRGLARLAAYNLAGALLILAAGIVPESARIALWMAGVFVMTTLPYLVPRWSWVGAASDFHVAAAHFVERHSLLVMLALGESVLALGMGATAEHMTASEVGLIVLALAVPGALWWTYFTDVEAAEHALGRRRGAKRSLLATRAYYFAHIPILLGIVIAAAGMHEGIAHPDRPLGWPGATALSAGVAGFLLGVGEVRREMAIASPRSRVLAAFVVLLLAPLGARFGAGAELGAILLVLVVMLSRDRGHTPPPTPDA
jgi:low temperature requirement protein LtrA